MNKRLIHVLVECPELIATVQVGVLYVLEANNNKFYKTKFVRTIDIKIDDIIWADILICVRGSEFLSVEIVEKAKKYGRFIIYYLDDDLLNLPQDCSLYDYWRVGNHDDYLKKILGYSDVLWGVNTRIRDKYIDYCGGKRWVWNRLPVEVDKIIKPNEETPIKILYAGSVSHEYLVQNILSPVVEHLCEEYGNRISFTFIGSNPGISKYPQVEYINYFENYNEFRDFVENGNFAIGLAVVNNDDFSQCKYYNKYVEYTSIGAVGVYTNCDLYGQVIKNGMNGILCDNNFENWIDAIELLINNGKLRNDCLKNAIKHMQEEFKTEKVSSHIIEQLPELKSYMAPKVSLNTTNTTIQKIKRWVDTVQIYNLYYYEKVKINVQEYGILSIIVIPVKAVKMIYRMTK